MVCLHGSVCTGYIFRPLFINIEYLYTLTVLICLGYLQLVFISTLYFFFTLKCITFVLRLSLLTTFYLGLRLKGQY